MLPTVMVSTPLEEAKFVSDQCKSTFHLGYKSEENQGLLRSNSPDGHHSSVNTTLTPFSRKKGVMIAITTVRSSTSLDKSGFKWKFFRGIFEIVDGRDDEQAVLREVYFRMT